MNLLELQKTIKVLSHEDQNVLGIFAYNPTDSNQSYFIGYIKAMRTHGILSDESYGFLLSIAGEILRDKEIASVVRAELRNKS